MDDHLTQTKRTTSSHKSHWKQHRQVNLKRGKRLFSPKNEMNTIYNNTTDDIEQLITMMKNHRVSDDICSNSKATRFDFNFGGKTNLFTQQSTASTLPSTLNTLPQFKFSFPLNIPQQEQQMIPRPNTPSPSPPPPSHHTINPPNINGRKILPLPKPRVQRIQGNHTPPSPPNHIKFHTPTDKSSADRDNKKKLKCSEEPSTTTEEEITNKRKERNWKDTFSTEAKPVIVETTIPPAPIEQTKKKPMTIQPKKTKALKQQNENISSSIPTAIKKKKKNKNKPKEDVAPGGFLSSDVTLFDSPISDDWICLFCQYDILFSSYKETKRKKSRQKKKEQKISTM